MRDGESVNGRRGGEPSHEPERLLDEHVANAPENSATVRGEVVDRGTGAHFGVVLPNGEIVRVHDGIPGELVRVRRDPDDPAWGRIEAWDSLSSARREPRCAFAAECGGCHWLSIDESRQQQFRRQRLLTQCAAHGVEINAATTITEIGSPAVTAYRHRARLQIDGALQPPRVGFHGDRNWAIVDAAVCAMFAPPLARVYETLRGLILGAAATDVADLTGAEIVALNGAAGALVYLNPRDRAPAAWPRLGEGWLSRRSDVLAGVAVRLPRGDSRPEILGAPAIWGQAPLGMPVAAAARGFVQANLGCAELLALTLAQRVRCVGARPRVLELYAGSGLFGWAMADAGADVRGVEWNAAAVAAAQRLPAPRIGSFLCEVGDSRTASLSDCDVLLTDAPRAGLGTLAQAIVEQGPPCVVLISCFVEALARDLGVLVRAGYVVNEWLLADFYPQTRHTETAVILNRPR